MLSCLSNQFFLQNGFSLLLLHCLFLASCSESNQENLQPEEMKMENRSSPRNYLIPKEPKFTSKDRTKQDIMKDFEKPLRTYPTIQSNEVEMDKNGLLYRKGLQNPFTGRLIELYKDGSLSVESSYLEGLPHGRQLRFFPDGNPALEAIFDNGILVGVKTKWWKNGKVREEEYWSEGEYRGRKMWDQFGRLSREELVPFD